MKLTLTFAIFLIPLFQAQAFAEEKPSMDGLYNGHPVVVFYAEELFDTTQLEGLQTDFDAHNSPAYYALLQIQEQKLKDARAEAVCQFLKGEHVKLYATTFVKSDKLIPVWDFATGQVPHLVYAQSYPSLPLEVFQAIFCKDSKHANAKVVSKNHNSQQFSTGEQRKPRSNGAGQKPKFIPNY